MTSTVKDINRLRPIIQRAFFLWVLVVLVYRFVSNTLLHQLNEPVLIYPAMDPTYWLFVLLRIPQRLVSDDVIAFGIDILLVMSVMLSFLFKKSVAFPRLFFVLYPLYFLTFNTFSAHHYHSVGIMILSVVFIFHDNLRFIYFFRAARYYLFFMMVSAALWKIFRGNLFQTEHFSAILMGQNIEFFVNQASDWKLALRIWLIDHTYAAHFAWVSMLLVELCFVIGFFTSRFDRWLLLLFVLFYIGAYLSMDIVSLENMVFIIVLIPWEKLQDNVGKKNGALEEVVA